jgi:RNA polymerase sigma-70 factor (ECF subfamily)
MLVSDLQDHRDRDLVHRIGDGDRAAFSELYRRYSSSSFGLAMRILGDRTMAEEVLQEVYLSVWRRASGYDPARGSVRSWIFAQIHHRSVDVVRREEAERRRSASTVQREAVDGEIDDVAEEDWLRARRAQVRSALEHLPPDQRRMIELAYYGGLTQSQVAQETGVPLGTVKSRTLAAMRRMRDALHGAALEDGWTTSS